MACIDMYVLQHSVRQLCILAYHTHHQACAILGFYLVCGCLLEKTRDWQAGDANERKSMRSSFRVSVGAVDGELSSLVA